MNFYKAAAVLILVAMALTSCKGSESNSSEPTPPAEETISMATACEEIKPLVLEASELFASPGPDFFEKINPILDEIDSIADSIETEEGRGAVLDMTQAWDKFIAAVKAGDGVGDSEKNSLAEISKTTDALSADCDKALLEN
jgi:hypothetical protein